MIIDCKQCEMYQTEHCEDCFVMAVLSRKGEGITIDNEEEEAIENLQQAGLAPVLKFRPKRAG